MLLHIPDILSADQVAHFRSRLDAAPWAVPDSAWPLVHPSAMRAPYISSAPPAMLASGERSGGGVKLNASATVNGKPLAVTINSTLREFDVAKPDAARGFGADARLVK